MELPRPLAHNLGSEDVPAPSPADRLLLAVRAADVAAVRELCTAHPGLAAQPSSGGRLPLAEAADRALLEVARVLLDAGADPRAGDPLLLAAHPGPHKQQPALAVIELLLARGVPDDIFVHALLGRVGALREALPRVDIDARGPASSTALFLAVWNGQVEAARVLLAAGADARLSCRNGQSAWQVALAHAWSPPHRELGRLLLEHGVECTLHEACVLSHLPTVRRLLAAQPDLVDAVNDAGRTPLDLAVLAADVELARVLLAAGAADPSLHGRVLIAAQPTRGGRFARSLFRDCSFETALFHDCNLKDTVLSNINLSGAKLVNVNLSDARIEDAFIKGLTIYGVEVEPLLAQELQRRAAGKRPAS
jgi:ankyrin repeat protein